jgi:hypothetical protein
MVTTLIPDRFVKTKMVEVDAEQIFLLYATFCGNQERTAYAANIEVEQVQALEAKLGWRKRCQALIELHDSGHAGDVERAINRALNFVQAHKFRLFLENLVREYVSMSPEALRQSVVVEKRDKGGCLLSTAYNFKQFADLAVALEKVHWMTYQALCDCPADRVKRPQPPGEREQSSTDLHARMAKALAEMREIDRKAQLTAQQEDAAISVPTVTP